MKRILLRRRASLGDVLNTTPIARRLRAENLDALIEVSTHHTDAYSHNPHVNGLQRHPDAAYDQIIDLNLSFEGQRRIHQVEANMLRAFGDAEGDRTICLHATPFHSQFPWARTVVIHPNCSWPQRTLPREWWEQMVVALERAGLFVVVTGTGRDWRLTRGHNLQGYLPLAAQAGLISQAACFLSGASGLVTVAGATETPIVPLVAVTPWENWGPFRHGSCRWNVWEMQTPLPCYGCDVDEPESEFYPCRRGDNACTTSFKVELVAAAVIDAIANDQRKKELVA